VDIEALRVIPERDSVARDFFSPPEYAAYCALRTQERGEGFFRCWTRKEAYIKATGEGLSVPLNSFAVSLDEHPQQLLLAGEAVTGHWLHHLHPAPGWMGAVAVQGGNCSVSCRDLEI